MYTVKAPREYSIKTYLDKTSGLLFNIQNVENIRKAGIVIGQSTKTFSMAFSIKS